MSCFATLKERGLKLTPQRRLIIDLIHDSSEQFSAEDIIAHVQTRMQGVNKSTIYRTLELLEEAGCVFKSEKGGQFIYHHAEMGHHHLVCSKCGKTIDCEGELFASLEKELEGKYRFRIDFKHLVMSGLCEKCKESLE